MVYLFSFVSGSYQNFKKALSPRLWGGLQSTFDLLRLPRERGLGVLLIRLALQEFAGCNCVIPTHNPVTTRKRSVIPTNTQFLATFRDTEGVARQNPKDP
jgi:hypothetical protein